MAVNIKTGIVKGLLRHEYNEESDEEYYNKESERRKACVKVRREAYKNSNNTIKQEQLKTYKIINKQAYEKFEKLTGKLHIKCTSEEQDLLVKIRVKCPCGTETAFSNLSKHMFTIAHLKYITEIVEESNL